MLPVNVHSVYLIDLFIKLNILLPYRTKVNIDVYLFYFLIRKMHHNINDDIGSPFLFLCDINAEATVYTSMTAGIEKLTKVFVSEGL
jgi:hypothetical protein